ncbi:thiamine biosynthesis protein ThiS [Frankia sp. EI5c]|uniref:sulfur carrier protein ThiS n=1 Tax=Frankia sp. EI5c TaxID=683316 RepID=UPI0007C3CF1A|nr:sulfur carrier protein ThiS [Frankia sp. EI5c]OAA28264.1 thiamine biosynthesis protein ThiS [Frankia sp. EI5c]
MSVRPTGVGSDPTPGSPAAGGDPALPADHISAPAPPAPAPAPAGAAGLAGSAGPSGAAGLARIVVNGQPREVPAGLALPDLLAQLGLRPGSVVVELRGTALTPSEMPAARLADGDILEIVRAVAGG